MSKDPTQDQWYKQDPGPNFSTKIERSGHVPAWTVGIPQIHKQKHIL
jgi:hypothetical protein